MEENKTYIAGLYLRLSSEDETNGESTSIGTQRSILTDFCKQRGYQIYDIYADDGYSGMNFARPNFERLLRDVERGIINMVITKDLSRLGRDYIMTGYYSEIYFPSKDVRYIAVADDFDSIKGTNEIAPFKNILNDMYARDISKKIKHAKLQRAKQGLYIGSQAPYGYLIDRDRHRLIVDPEAASVIQLIFSMAADGLGNILIAAELKNRSILTPSAYKYQHKNNRYAHLPPVIENKPYDWCDVTIDQILHDPVYTGQMTTHKTEVVNCKTKKNVRVPPEEQIVTPNAHEPIISQALFDQIRQIRANRGCRANTRRENLFRGKLFCDCCGHTLAITKKVLLAGPTDMYFCMHHYNRPDVCPKTHRVYHDMLYPYVLQQIRAFAKTMKRRKINSSISDYSTIQELTPQILNDVIERIEIGHVTKKSKPGSVIQIYWKLR